jgi:hypothetical protein
MGIRHLGEDANRSNIVLELYSQKLISVGQKDQFFKAAGATFDVLEVYNNAVAVQQKAILDGTQTVDGALAVLHDILGNQALDTINKMITSLNLMDAVKASRLFAWVKAIAAATLKVMDTVHIPRTQLVAVKS